MICALLTALSMPLLTFNEACMHADSGVLGVSTKSIMGLLTLIDPIAVSIILY